MGFYSAMGAQHYHYFFTPFEPLQQEKNSESGFLLPSGTPFQSSLLHMLTERARVTQYKPYNRAIIRASEPWNNSSNGVPKTAQKPGEGSLRRPDASHFSREQSLSETRIVCLCPLPAAATAACRVKERERGEYAVEVCPKRLYQQRRLNERPQHRHPAGPQQQACQGRSSQQHSQDHLRRRGANNVGR